MRLIDADLAVEEMPNEIKDYAYWIKAQPAAIEGVVSESETMHRRFVRVKPIEHHYEEPGEEPYIKYGCPVCEAIGNRHSVTQGEKTCPLCGVNLSWEN